MENAEVTEDGAETHVPMPSGQEVEELREEVEQLRKQLQELKQAEASARAVAKMAEPVQAAATPAPVPDAPAAIAMSLPRAAEPTVLMGANEPAPTFATPAVPQPIQPPVAASVPEPHDASKVAGLAEDVAEAKRTEAKVGTERKGQVPMSLPNWAKPKLEPPKIDPEQEVIDQLLPEPELDFSKAPKLVRSDDPNDPFSIYKPTRAKMGKWTLTALIVVLVGMVAAGVWKLGVVQNLMMRRQRNAVATAVATPPASVPAKAVAANGQLAESGAAATPTPVTATVKAVTPSVAPAKEITAEIPPNGKRAKGAKAADFHTAGPTPDAARKVVAKNNANAASKGAKKKKRQKKWSKK